MKLTITAAMPAKLVPSLNSVVHDLDPAACALHNDREWEMTGEDGECRYYRTRPKVQAAISLSRYDYAEPEEQRSCGWWKRSQSSWRRTRRCGV
jgi:hypothetical protein